MELPRYLAMASAYAAIFWVIYQALLRNRPAHRASRVFLLLSLFLSEALPLIRLPERIAPATGQISLTLPALRIGTPATESTASSFNWIAAGYIAGCLLFAIVYLIGYTRIRSKLRTEAQQFGGYKVLTNTGIGPGTLGRRIFIPGATITPSVLSHELAHISAGHRFDLIFLLLNRVLFWISPAHWLLGRELKVVHEFEADAIACKDAAPEAYAVLLMQAQLGIPHVSFSTHAFFHHPLKRRIMMLKRNSGSSKFVAAALILAAGFTTAAVFAQSTGTIAPAKQTRKPLDPDVLRNNYLRPQSGTVQTTGDGRIMFTTVDKMPGFKGELWTWLAQNGRAPEKDIEGKVVVQFTVDQTGAIVLPIITESSKNPRLDAEALRLVSAMPKWGPGIQHGKPVAVLCTLPIYFGRLGAGC
jgi:TonB family protein